MEVRLRHPQLRPDADQLSSRPKASNRLDTRQFSHAHLRRLRADVLADAIVTVTGPPKFYGAKLGSPLEIFAAGPLDVGCDSFEGDAEVALEGLPKGVVLLAPHPRITSASKVVAFELEASAEALLGPVRGIRAAVAITAGGQTVTQRSGQGTLRIDPAR